MFIDTSVLVNARILEAPQHDVARASLEQAFAGPEALRISRQIVREYLAVVTRPQSWPVPITREQALEDAGRLLGACLRIDRRRCQVKENRPRRPSGPIAAIQTRVAFPIAPC